MVFLSTVFLPQAHKMHSGYGLNHDVLMSVSQCARRKLIFYYIAQNSPQKLNPTDHQIYSRQKVVALQTPIALATLTGLLLPFKFGMATGFADRPLTKGLRFLGAGLLISGFMNAVAWRVMESRMLEKNNVFNTLSTKYDFSVHDFAIAKKESHIKKTLEVMGEGSVPK